MIGAFWVRHCKAQGNLLDPRRNTAGQPVGAGVKNQFVDCSRVDLFGGMSALSRPPSSMLDDSKTRPVLQSFKVTTILPGMGAVAAVQGVGCQFSHYSIDALSRLSEVAATMGLMTPRHLTLTIATFPLLIARFKAGASCSLVSTNSPCPPMPSHIE